MKFYAIVRENPNEEWRTIEHSIFNSKSEYKKTINENGLTVYRGKIFTVEEWNNL